jgi:hypothetical protein
MPSHHKCAKKANFHAKAEELLKGVGLQGRSHDVQGGTIIIISFKLSS